MLDYATFILLCFRKDVGAFQAALCFGLNSGQRCSNKSIDIQEEQKVSMYNKAYHNSSQARLSYSCVGRDGIQERWVSYLSKELINGTIYLSGVSPVPEDVIKLFGKR